MRRAWLVIGLASGASTVQAAPWIVTAEGGAEADSNVQRVETGPGLPTSASSAAALRLGGRVDHRDQLLDGAYSFALSGLARIVGDPKITTENITLFSGDLRWMRPIGSRPVAIGVAITAADVVALTGGNGARAFSNLGADIVLAVRSGEDRHLTLAIGGRDFRYKPAPAYDWSGPVASARLDLMLWQPSGKTKSLELAATAGFEARTYGSNALANACAIDEPIDPTCFAPTSLVRRDRFERASLELTWVGSFVGAIGYQLTVVDSNSFGQSLTRHRATASATVSLPWSSFATVLGTLQIDRFTDGLIVQTDLQHSEFTSLDDENRSSVQFRVARAVTSTWSLEGRAAAWRDLGGNTSSNFQRSLVYLGAIYTH